MTISMSALLEDLLRPLLQAEVEASTSCFRSNRGAAELYYDQSEGDFAYNHGRDELEEGIGSAEIDEGE